MLSREGKNRSCPKNLKALLARLRKIQLPKDPKYLTIAGAVLLAAAVILFVLIFYPVISSEIRYALDRGKTKKVVSREDAPAQPVNGEKVLVPVDEDFGIVIPKIEANAKVVSDVDAQNPAAYQRAITQGVAQAAGSANPGEEGNIFIFAHSGQDLLQANKYNAVFYLLSKLEKGDEIYIFYQSKKFHYLVTGKNVVNPDAVSYMDNAPGQKNLTLMTCWPGGTTWKRLIITAEQAQ